MRVSEGISVRVTGWGEGLGTVVTDVWGMKHLCTNMLMPRSLHETRCGGRADPTGRPDSPSGRPEATTRRVGSCSAALWVRNVWKPLWKHKVLWRMTEFTVRPIFWIRTANNNVNVYQLLQIINWWIKEAYCSLNRHWLCQSNTTLSTSSKRCGLYNVIDVFQFGPPCIQL